MPPRQPQGIEVEEELDAIRLPGGTIPGVTGMGGVAHLHLQRDRVCIPVQLPGTVLQPELSGKQLVLHHPQRIMEKIPAKVQYQFRVLPVAGTYRQSQHTPTVRRNGEADRHLRNQRPAQQTG